MPRRTRVAEIVAFIGLVAAFIGALGPAGEARTSYSWPPENLPEATPTRLWYTPLLLATRIPERLAATIPCALPDSLPGASSPTTVLATARAPVTARGLVITSDGEALTVKVGSTILARIPGTNRRVGQGCVNRLEFVSGRWSLEGDGTGGVHAGELEEMPVVNGLFSGVDIRPAPHPTVEVTTQTHGVVTSRRQSAAWIVAAICASAALLLVAFDRAPQRRRSRIAHLGRRALSEVGLADAAIGALLLGWWLIAPALFDDGWTIARQTAFKTTGGFSQYYESFGVPLPLGYWLEWVQHWITQSTDELVLLRLPALLCLAATWVLSRWILAHLLDRSQPGHTVALWALTVSFAAMAMAWGMTLRQEPTVALLVAGVMACCVRFAREPGVGPLAIAAILIPLAATAHPAGIVALAPLIAVSPAAIRWARDRPASAVAVFTASGALLLTLAFVGSDVQVRASDARTLREASYTVVDWRDELTRYTYLTDEDPDGVTGYGTPLRRAAAALMLLAALGFIGRARRERRALLDLPALTLVTALLMLVATPSKWPWHFGALIAVVAVAVATETVRVHDDSSRGWRARPFVVIAAVVLAIAWSWSPRGGWNVIDLRTLDWTPAIEAWLPFSKLAIALPLVLLAGGMTVAWRRGRGAPSVPWRVASWSAPMLVVPLVAFTAGVLIVDAVRTESWTTTRANLQALAGERTCGVASELPVLDDNSPQALPIHEAAGRTRTSRWVPRPPVSGLPVFALGPAVEATSSSPWFSVSRGQRPGLFVSGEIATRDRLELEWGEVKDGRIERLRSDDVDISLTSERNATLPWRFVSAGELAVPPTEATLVRLTLFNDERSRSAVAVTAPVIYTNESLEQRLRVPVTVALVQPNVLTFLPCARLPRLADGIVEVPETLVTTKDSFGPVQYFETSPFAGVFDLYDLERLPLADSENPPRTFVVFGVDRRVQGAVLAPPDRTTTIS